MLDPEAHPNAERTAGSIVVRRHTCCVARRLSWYLDLDLLMKYWSEPRNYHHTAPTAPFYGLREALRLVAEEGLESQWTRHREVAGALVDALADLGLELFPDRDHWVPSLNAISVPDGVDDQAVIDHLREAYEIEIASGLGALGNEIWRIGCMGYSARPQVGASLLTAMDEALAAQGHASAWPARPHPPAPLTVGRFTSQVGVGRAERPLPRRLSGLITRLSTCSSGAGASARLSDGRQRVPDGDSEVSGR